MTRISGLRHHQRFRQRAAEMIGEFAPGHFGDIADEGAVLFKSHVVFLVQGCTHADRRDVTGCAGIQQPLVPQSVQIPAREASQRRSARCHKNARWFLLPRRARASARAAPGPRPFRWWRDRRMYRRWRRPGDKRETAARRWRAPSSISAASTCQPPPVHRSASRRTAWHRRSAAALNVSTVSRRWRAETPISAASPSIE